MGSLAKDVTTLRDDLPDIYTTMAEGLEEAAQTRAALASEHDELVEFVAGTVVMELNRIGGDITVAGS